MSCAPITSEPPCQVPANPPPDSSHSTVMLHGDRTAHWISVLHDALPVALRPRNFVDQKTFTRRIYVVESAIAHLINLMNAGISLPPSVFIKFADRKEQYTQTVLRLKRLLGIGHIPFLSAADVFEAAYVRIRELESRAPAAVIDLDAEMTAGPLVRGTHRGTRPSHTSVPRPGPSPPKSAAAMQPVVLESRAPAAVIDVDAEMTAGPLVRGTHRGARPSQASVFCPGRSPPQPAAAVQPAVQPKRQIIPRTTEFFEESMRLQEPRIAAARKKLGITMQTAARRGIPRPATWKSGRLPSGAYTKEFLEAKAFFNESMRLQEPRLAAAYKELGITRRSVTIAARAKKAADKAAKAVEGAAPAPVATLGLVQEQEPRVGTGWAEACERRKAAGVRCLAPIVAASSCVSGLQDGPGCTLPSIQYVLKDEALGYIDRLAIEIRDFEISEGLKRN
ncbi:hypothetical protein B0H11DRAFT_2310081 [Mycena galericulata]|nr:hypothetical protein B0H11DRAFT_2310081 [Mycena galericulata]